MLADSRSRDCRTNCYVVESLLYTCSIEWCKLGKDVVIYLWTSSVMVLCLNSQKMAFLVVKVAKEEEVTYYESGLIS